MHWNAGSPAADPGFAVYTHKPNSLHNLDRLFEVASGDATCHNSLEPDSQARLTFKTAVCLAGRPMNQLLTACTLRAIVYLVRPCQSQPMLLAAAQLLLWLLLHAPVLHTAAGQLPLLLPPHHTAAEP